MFAEIYLGLNDLMQENGEDTDLNRAKKFVNWSLNDLCNEYDWEFLRGSMNLTASASGLYDLKNITQPSASATIYAICELSADNDVEVTIRGNYLASNVIYASAASVNASSTATASASGIPTGFSTIENIVKPVTNGSIYITTGSGNIICTLGATDTYVANDINKINKIVNTTGNKNVVFFDYNNQLEGNPDLSQQGNTPGYDLDHEQKLRIYNLDSTRIMNIYFSRVPKFLVFDQDRPEFPKSLYPEIIQYAYEVYGKRYEDEQDALPGNILFAVKKEMAGNVVRKWTMGKDKKLARVMPVNFKRSL